MNNLFVRKCVLDQFTLGRTCVTCLKIVKVCKRWQSGEDAPSMEFIYPVFTCMPGGDTVVDSGLSFCVPCLLSAINSICLLCLKISLTCYSLCFWQKPTELAHAFSVLVSYFCLYGPFNCISFHKFSRQLSAFSICSSGLISAVLVLSTLYLFM